MKTLSLFIFLSILLLNSFGQVRFEKGYFINNASQKIECLIKNYDHKNSPREIEYKIDDQSESQKAGIEEIAEFGILGSFKFIKVQTNIDRSSRNLSKLSANSNPEWSFEQLFLRVLIEGKASLYSYEDKTTSVFFYSVADSGIKQLVYKEYRSADDKYLLTNYTFRQQLWTEIRCANASLSSVENIQYSESALKKYFTKYNEKCGSIFIDYKIARAKNPFHLKINSGFNVISASFATDDPVRSTYFDTELDYRLGMEIEYVIPINKNKWSTVLEPSFQHYSSESENFLGSAEIQYNSLEFSLGLRYYAYIHEKLNFFANALWVFNSGINLNSQITFGYPYAAPVLIYPEACLSFGIGLNYRRLSSEIRYYTTRNIRSNDSELLITSLIIGYRIF